MSSKLLAQIIFLTALILIGIFLIIPKYDFFISPDGQVCRANKISGKLDRAGAIFDDGDFPSSWGFN